MNDVICLAPAHLEEVLDGFGGDRAQTADEDEMLGGELWEQDGDEVSERVVKEDVENYANQR